MMAFAQIHWDFTISVPTVVAFVTALIALIIGWRDFLWRIKNLETWRLEHMVDSDARDDLQAQMGQILARLEWVDKHRKSLVPWDGEERRNKDGGY